eukprot:TRINITY_DN6410_c0_g2_i1.p1 TRINITY_DN6410_c0_g2~~TRINITY_DN6410_c0_g2_i1.p1  ORF type:complete len:654 (+),score=62.46 TRINITY_DN6410_c0_g2_i1:72-2033(+)
MQYLLTAVLSLWCFDVARSCTVLGAGKGLTTDGSTITSHSDDGEYNGDFRLCRIPATSGNKNGSMRPVFYDLILYPRYVTRLRGPCYFPEEGQKEYEPIGYIPQVESTFAYFESNYGIMNEKGLGLSESTCSGMFSAKAMGYGGKALFGISALGQVALERSSEAREAIKLMGSLAEEYGFYGANSFEGGAESLLVHDANEIWIFDILPDPLGSSAIWAAQRIPDNHVTVLANMFTIRNIDFEDTDNFMFSASVREVAESKNWWKPGQPFDFTKIYSYGEYAHKYYSGRRMWDAYRLFGLNYSDTYTDLRYDPVYPVSAQPVSYEAGIGPRHFMKIHRSYMEGTKYDMTVGPAAGPWGIPDRWNNAQSTVKGHWERSIAQYRTTYLHIAQSRSGGNDPIFWYAPHGATATVYVPVNVRIGEVPFAYSGGSPAKLDRNTAYWAAKYSMNIAHMKHRHAMEDIRSLQDELEKAGETLVARVDQECMRQPTCDFQVQYHAHMQHVLKKMWEMPDIIMEKYADGWINDREGPPYPAWWLKDVGYANGPPPVPPEPSPGVKGAYMGSEDGERYPRTSRGTIRGLLQISQRRTSHTLNQKQIKVNERDHSSSISKNRRPRLRSTVRNQDVLDAVSFFQSFAVDKSNEDDVLDGMEVHEEL